jgi:periplasmic copper chaperone A
VKLSRTALVIFFTIVVFHFSSSISFAHVVVKPTEITTSARTNFVVSVPTEGNSPTVELKLLIPEGLKSIRPNVKPGWNIQIKKESDNADARVTEIIWSKGNIPAGMRDEFVFSAQVGDQPTSLNWKAFQKYQSGQIVPWDQEPQTVTKYLVEHPEAAGSHADEIPKPFSITKVIAQTENSPSPASQTVATQSQPSHWTPLLLASNFLALVIAGIALAVAMKKR